MAIITPDVPFVGPGRSQINPADTYVRPAESGLSQVAKALSDFGIGVERGTAVIDEKRQREYAQKHDFYVNKIMAEREAGVPLAQQSGALPLDMSTENRIRITQSVAANDFDGSDFNTRLSDINSNPDLLNDRDKYNAAIEQLRQDANKAYGTDPIYAAGFIRNMDRRIQQSQGMAETARTEFSRSNLNNALLGEAFDAADEAANEEQFGAADGRDHQDPDSAAGSFNKAAFVNHIASPGGPEGHGKNPRSTAVGVGQFLDATWRAFAPAGFKDPRNKTNPLVARQTLVNFTNHNEAVLKKRGLPVNGMSMYLMHFAGEGEAPKIMRAADNTRIEDVMRPAAITANPHLRGKSVGWVKRWAAKAGKQGGYSGVASAQQAVRDVDGAWATSGYDNSYRAEVLTKGFVERAIQAQDLTILERIPPEYITPERQSMVEDARTKIQALQYTAYEREQKIKKDERDNFVLAEKNKIDAALADPNFDPNTYSGDFELHEYAVQQARKELYITPQESDKTFTAVREGVETAAITGNWSAFGFDKDPTDTELMAKINSLPINSADRQKLRDAIPQMRDLSKMFNSEQVNKAREATSGILFAGAKDRLNNPSEQADVQDSLNTLFDQNFREEYAATYQSLGHAPQGLDYLQMMDRVKAKTKAEGKEYLQGKTEDIAPKTSVTNRASFGNAFSTMAVTGDWSQFRQKFTPDDAKNPNPPTYNEMLDAINKLPLSKEDHAKLVEDLPKLVDTASYFQTGAVAKNFDQYFMPLVKQSTDNPVWSAFAQDAAVKGFNPEIKAREIYNTVIQEEVRNLKEMPWGAAPTKSFLDRVNAKVQARIETMIGAAAQGNMEQAKAITTGEPRFATMDELTKAGVAPPEDAPPGTFPVFIPEEGTFVFAPYEQLPDNLKASFPEATRKAFESAQEVPIMPSVEDLANTRIEVSLGLKNNEVQVNNGRGGKKTIKKVLGRGGQPLY